MKTLAKLQAMGLPEGPIVHEPRWPAIVTALTVTGLYAALPDSLSVGPRWIMPAVILSLLIPTIITHRKRAFDWNKILGHILSGIVTLYMLSALTLLLVALPEHKESPKHLLLSAMLLWMANVLVFALWYWRLDAGGPNMRDLRRGHGIGHREGAFLFPQMTMDETICTELGQDEWHPEFVDYLFVAFNTSTAFSPTDTAVISRWAKLLMMVQSAISLIVIALLAARAVNIL